MLSFFFVHITSILTFMEQVLFSPFILFFFSQEDGLKKKKKMTSYSQKKSMPPLESLSFLASLPNMEIGQKCPSCNNVYFMRMHQGESGAVCWQTRGLWLQQRRRPPCTWSRQLWNLAGKKGISEEHLWSRTPFVSPLPKSPPDIQLLCRVHAQSPPPLLPVFTTGG